MPTESQIMERVHEVDKEHAETRTRVDSLEKWVASINKTVRATDRKVTLGIGAILGIELVFKLWQ